MDVDDVLPDLTELSRRVLKSFSDRRFVSMIDFSVAVSFSNIACSAIGTVRDLM